MKKLLAATALLASAAMITPGFAETNSSSSSSSPTSSSSSVSSSADLACMASAVNTRETAVINARTAYDASVLAAMNTRRTSLAAAFTISNDKDRQVALKASWDAYLKAGKAARAKYRTDVQTAWKTFVQAGAQCNLATDRGVRNKMKQKNEPEDDKKGRGAMMQSLMGSVHTNADVKSGDANAGAQLDLSF